jgi:hypothetical protein
MKAKKAQGLTLNTVVIAILVLVVLGVLLFIVYKYILGAGTSFGELSKCGATGNGGHCESTCPSNENAFKGMGDCGIENYCCIPPNNNGIS